MIITTETLSFSFSLIFTLSQLCLVINLIFNTVTSAVVATFPFTTIVCTTVLVIMMCQFTIFVLCAGNRWNYTDENRLKLKTKTCT